MPTSDALIHWLQSLEMLLPAVAITVGVIAAIIAVTILTLNLMDIWRLAGQRAVFIELTPPAQTDRTAAATQRLFSVLHGMEGSRSTIDKLLRRRVVFSAEIVGTREQCHSVWDYRPDWRYLPWSEPILSSSRFSHGYQHDAGVSPQAWMMTACLVMAFALSSFGGL